jgi:hypothetical protein
MKSAILFGRSEFINQISISPSWALTLIGCNSCPIKVNHLFFYDGIKPQENGILHGPIQRKGGHEPFKAVGADRPIIRKYTREGIEILGFNCFTPSLALNWLINRHYERVWLVGIDHRDDDWTHCDGHQAKQPSSEANAKFKTYVANCARHLEIYQTNPAVRDAWPIPFMEMDQVYDQIEKSQTQGHA